MKNREIVQGPQPGFTDGIRYIFKRLGQGWERKGGAICTVAGTAGLFFTAGHACRKTYKIHDQLTENGRKIAEAKKKISGEKKSARIWRVTKTIGECSLKTSKYYIADGVGAALSAYAVSKGWHKEHQHYQQAAAMVGVLAADFLNYRNNVIAEAGEEADRRYLTKKAQRNAYIDDQKDGTQEQKSSDISSGDAAVVDLDPSHLRIWYSRETTPTVWHDSKVLRECQLVDIQKHLEMDLMYGGSYTVNDVRRYFYGRKGDVPEGGMFGRIWDPGNPEHPKRGAMVNLHWEEDEDFRTGRTDSCWIIIDIDEEPLFELMKQKKDREILA